MGVAQWKEAGTPSNSPRARAWSCARRIGLCETDRDSDQRVHSGSFTAPVGDLQVIVPVEVVSAQLPATDDGVATIGKHARKPLGDTLSVLEIDPGLFSA